MSQTPNRLLRDVHTEEPPLSKPAPLRVRQVIRRYLIQCGPETPIHEAARRMQKERCGSIVITDQEGVRGIWTERDALALTFAEAEQFERPIAEVMTSPVRTISANTDLNEVAELFREYRLRHLLVVEEDGSPMGMVSNSDVVLNQGIEHFLHLKPAASVVSGAPPCLDAEATIDQAAQLMRNQRKDAIAVSYPNGEHGIITERDMVRFIATMRRNEPIGPLASRPLITVDSMASLYRARAVLVENRLRHIGVRDSASGELQGIICLSDILTGIELAYVGELRQALLARDQALNISQHHLRLAEKVIEASLEGIMITAPDGTIESVNPAFTRLTGYRPEEVVGQNPSILHSGRHDEAFYEDMWQGLARDGHWQGEIWNQRKNGEVFPELLTITAIHDRKGELINYAAFFNDISDLKRSEERVKTLAYYDSLTELPNRRLLQDRLSVAIAHAHRNQSKLAVLFVDLDNFKRINDGLGHDTGDRLLREVARRLNLCVREDDTVARMGGDEFILVLSEIPDIDNAAFVARRVINMLKRPLEIDGRELIVTTSVGISVYPEDGGDTDTLLKNADTAMYRAKETGRDSYQLYAPSMNALSHQHLELEVQLRRALERDELTVYYQPLVDCEQHAIVGAEALLRWQHPERGLIPPADFIPLAEETGLIIPMGEWVLRQACRQHRAWLAEGLGPLHIAINISARQFLQHDFLAVSRRILAEERIDPSVLTFELTESMLMHDVLEATRTLDGLRAVGVDIAVDDFGTGYSSLSYLKRFPVQVLKIDRSFIRGIADDPQDAAIVSSIVQLGHSLKLRIVAEGVEEISQLETLRDCQCDLLQGYFFGRPCPPAEFAELVRDKSPGRVN